MRRYSLLANLALLLLIVISTVACGVEASPTTAPPRADYTTTGVAPAATGTSNMHQEPARAFNPGAPLPTSASAAAGAPSDARRKAGETTEALEYGTTAGPAAPPAMGGGSGLTAGRPAPGTYQSPLTAGQVDDNAKFADYLAYLGSYRGPAVHSIPVAQRMFVRVLDKDQQPVAGARVQLFDDARPVFDGRTVSDGRILFFPQGAAVTQTPQLRAVIRRGQQQREVMLQVGNMEQAVTLPDLADNTGAVGLDLVFLLDATGSMGDEIDKIKTTVDSIAARIEQVPGSSRPRFGLVAYRDRGDAYVTRAWDFTNDVPQFSANLGQVDAGGGGDTPESVNAGLHDAIHLPGWVPVESGRHLRMIVLVGDAPPHLDYQDDYEYTMLLQEAVAAGIKIFPIGASNLADQGEYIFRQFAQVTQGQFVFLTYANGVSGAPGIATAHHVSDFTVSQLDTLVVNLVAGEIANQTGARTGSSDPAPVPVTVSAPAPTRQPDFLASLATTANTWITNVTSPTVFPWLLLVLLAGAWIGRSQWERARRLAAPVPFAAPTPGAAAPPTAARVRDAHERTTILPAALTRPAETPVDVYLTVDPAGHPTTPLTSSRQ